MALALIPSWQFSQDPVVNINLNPALTFPPGVNQLSVQPFNNVVTSGDANLQGFGTPMASWLKPAVGVPGLGFFDTVWWQQRKWIVLGGLGIVGLAGLLLAGKFLR